MSNTTNVKVRTKVSKDSTESKLTELTINWDVDQDIIVGLAQRAVVIMQQSIYRTSGVIPSTDTIDVSKVMEKQPRAVKVMTPQSIMDLVNSGKLSKEGLLALLK